MRRASQKKKPIDARQFDLFVSVASLPEIQDGHDTPHPLSEGRARTPYEAEVLDVLVGWLNRQWADHLSANTPSRSRPAR